MLIAGQLILGLGLFFLGMQLVGENLRRLSGPSFRALMARSTGSPWETGLLGVTFGVLMQLLDDLKMLAWVLHRLAKLMAAALPQPETSDSPQSTYSG